MSIFGIISALSEKKAVSCLFEGSEWAKACSENCLTWSQVSVASSGLEISPVMHYFTFGHTVGFDKSNIISFSYVLCWACTNTRTSPKPRNPDRYSTRYLDLELGRHIYNTCAAAEGCDAFMAVHLPALKHSWMCEISFRLSHIYLAELKLKAFFSLSRY